MIPDPIVEEVRAIRDEIAKESGYDIAAIFEALRHREAVSPVPPVTLASRAPEPDPPEFPAIPPVP